MNDKVKEIFDKDIDSLLKNIDKGLGEHVIEAQYEQLSVCLGFAYRVGLLTALESVTLFQKFYAPVDQYLKKLMSEELTNND